MKFGLMLGCDVATLYSSGMRNYGKTSSDCGERNRNKNFDLAGHHDATCTMRGWRR